MEQHAQIIELRHLRALQAVAEAGTLTAAAHRLHQSPGTVTTDIGTLEHHLGVQLISRDTRRVTLTPAGHVLLDVSQGVHTTLAQAVRAARFAGTTGLRRVQIGHNGIAGIQLLQRALHDLSTGDTAMSFGLNEAPNTELLARLTHGHLDLALVCPPIDNLTLGHERLLEDELVLVVNTTHPLTQHDRITWPDLQDEPFVLPPQDRQPDQHHLLLHLCRQHGHFQPAHTQEADSVTGMLLLIAAGAGISLLPRRWADHHRSPGTKTLRLHNPTPTLTVHLAWQQGATTAIVTHVRTAIIAAAGNRRSTTRRHTTPNQEPQTHLDGRNRRS